MSIILYVFLGVASESGLLTTFREGHKKMQKTKKNLLS